MKDYRNIIEANLDRFMPKMNIALFETEQYVDKAPKVNGYFKFISIKYMKRVVDIKKMCIEYINTYIDGALNLAKNMDDVKLKEAQDSLANDNGENLAKSLDFKKAGASTSNQEKEAVTKSGVLFLTGDKALADKLKAIVDKINVRSAKSDALKEWANLMLLQSKIQANDIIYEKSAELLKEGKDEQLKKLEESKKKTEAELKKVESVHKEYQKQLDDLLNKYGEVEQWFKNMKNVKLADLVKEVTSVKPEDFSKSPVTEDRKPSEDGTLNKARNDFYNANGFTSTYIENIEKASEFKSKNSEQANDLTEPEWNYIIACSNVEAMDKDGKFTASPIDIVFTMANTPEAYELLKKSGHEKTVNGVDLNLYKIKDFDEAKMKKVRDMFLTDKNFNERLVMYFSKIFSEDSSKLKEVKESRKRQIMKSSQFITEEMIANTINLQDAESAIMDVLDDCDDGCLYVGNIPELSGIDYIMMDGDGGYGFFVEQGNVSAALKKGEPIKPYPVEIYDNEKLELLNIVLDKVSDDILSKLK